MVSPDLSSPWMARSCTRCQKWFGRDDAHRAAKLHLHFGLLKDAPESATLTHAQASDEDLLAHIERLKTHEKNN